MTGCNTCGPERVRFQSPQPTARQTRPRRGAVRVQQPRPLAGPGFWERIEESLGLGRISSFLLGLPTGVVLVLILDQIEQASKEREASSN